MNTAITANELTEILRLHELWLQDQKDGKRANLRYANLRYADLRYADLSYANLSYANLSYADLSYANLRSADLRSADLRYADLRSANLLYIGQDIRGYLFYGWHDDNNVVVIRAGCHTFTGISAARDHWQNRHVGDDVLHDDCLSLVDRAERMAKVRGWLLEPVVEAVTE